MMLKIVIGLFILWSTVQFVRAQPVLSDHHLFMITITDAIGNHDSLWFGTSDFASPNSLNPNLGEYQINQNDTSSLIFAINKGKGLQSKKVYAPLFSYYKDLRLGYFMDSIFYLNQTVGNFENNAPIFITCKARYFPLEIKVKQLDVDSSFIDKLNLWRIYSGEYQKSSIFYQFEIENFKTKDKLILLNLNDISLRTDSTFQMYILFFNFLTPYNETLFDQVIIYPNPVSHYLQIQSRNKSDFLQYSIYDLNGTQIQSGLLTADLIDISRLNNGLYSIVFKSKHGKYLAKKIIVSKN